MIDFVKPRLYRDSADLRAMKNILSQGILAGGPAFYVHPGDIQWWLFFLPFSQNLFTHTWVWDDPFQDGELLAWMLVDPKWSSIELFVKPELFGSDLHDQFYLWAETEAVRLCKPDKQKLYKLWIAENDLFQRSYLEARGFGETVTDTFFLRSLAESLTAPEINGWTIRCCRGLDEVQERARSQYEAFGSSKPFESYLERFVKFMHTEAYADALDIVAVNATGQIGAFCIAWLDEQTLRGHLEPVGTHPNFQRQGLGKAVILDAFRRMQLQGMTSASVVTEKDNTPAQGLYAKLGFKAVEQLSTYSKIFSCPETG